MGSPRQPKGPPPETPRAESVPQTPEQALEAAYETAMAIRRAADRSMPSEAAQAEYARARAALGAAALSSQEAARRYLFVEFGEGTAVATLAAAAWSRDLAAGAFDDVRSHGRTVVLVRQLRRTLKAIEGLRAVAPETNAARQVLDNLQTAVEIGHDQIGPTALGLHQHILRSYSEAPKDAARRERRRREEPRPFREEVEKLLFGGVLRRGLRQRRLFMLFHECRPDAANLDPLDLAAIFLCVGFPGEGPTSDKSTITKRLDLWRKARADVIELRGQLLLLEVHRELPVAVRGRASDLAWARRTMQKAGRKDLL